MIRIVDVIADVEYAPKYGLLCWRQLIPVVVDDMNFGMTCSANPAGGVALLGGIHLGINQSSRTCFFLLMPVSTCKLFSSNPLATLQFPL